MPEEQTADPMAEYKAQLEEHEFLKREGIKVWIDSLLDILGDKIPEDRRPLIIEGLMRFMGVGAPRYPMDNPAVMSFPPGAVPMVDAEFMMPIFEETGEDGVTRVYDWQTIAQGATHAEYYPKIGHVVLYDYADELLTLTGPAATSFWEWSERMRKGPSPIRGPRRVHRRNPRRPR